MPFALFIYFKIKLEGTVRRLPSAGEPDKITSVFSVPWCSLSWRVCLAHWTQYQQTNLSIYPLNAAISKWPASQI